MSNDEKGLSGFKKSEFVSATPERVFSGSDVHTEDLPDGVRLYLREKAVDLGTKKVSVNVYRLFDDGGLKTKRVWVGKLKMNRKPEDEELAEQFGGGTFNWILKWVGPDGKECGIISDNIEIDEELGRAAHDAWKRRQAPADSTPANLAAAPAAPAPAVANQFGVTDILKIMAATEEKTLATMERMMAMANGQKQETPTEILKSAYAGASDMIQKAVETNLRMGESVRKVQQERMRRDEEEEFGEEMPEAGAGEQGPEVPEFLKPFWPMVQSGLQRLLAGGPVGAAAKTLLLSSDEWKGIFNDPDKWGQAVSAMEKHYGPDRTRQALDILLNRRAESKPGKKKGK